LLFADVPGGTALAKRLDDLARRRPNVTVVAGGPKDAVAAATGELVLVLGPQVSVSGARLLPTALADLAHFAQAHDCEVVLGRVDLAAGTQVDDLLIADAPRVSEVPDSVLASAVALYRRDFLTENGLAGAAAALTKSQKVGIAGANAALVIPATGDTGGALQLASTTAAWTGPELSITVQGSTGAEAAGQAVLLSIRHLGRDLEYWLPTDGTVADDGSFTGSTRLDPRTAARGDALATGLWVVQAGTHGTTARPAPRRPVPATSVARAIIDGMLVVPDSRASSLTLDIGAERNSVVPPLSPADVTIGETHRGTLLEATLPGVHSTGESRTKGSVLLGKFRLPAYLVAADGGVRLECYLSGIPGSSVVSTVFGRTNAPTDLALTISPVGAMSVRPAPREDAAPKVPARKAAAKKVAAKKVSQPAAARPAAPKTTIARLRRKVPAALEPLVVRVRQNPAARRVYRKLAGLPPR
jgi:hypothetical protein